MSLLVYDRIYSWSGNIKRKAASSNYVKLCDKKEMRFIFKTKPVTLINDDMDSCRKEYGSFAFNITRWNVRS
jgi:hypothetical protein